MIPEGWKERTISEILTRVSKPVCVNKAESYNEIGIRSHSKGIFHKEPVSGDTLGNKRVFHIESDCFVVNIVFAWEQAIAKTSDAELGMIASHRFPMFKPSDNLCNIDYILNFFKTKKGKYLLGIASPGGAGRNKTLGQSTFAELRLLLPPIDEQQKIAKILSTWDMAISTAEQLLESSLQQKKAIMQQILTGKKRLLDEYGKRFSQEWKKVELGNLLDYLQPTPYLVATKNYSDDFETPVLTAGKKFVLGYTEEKNGIFKDNLPAIIFDDFTTASKYVDFPFKAKSSAMKILVARDGVSTKYVFEAMQMLNYPIGGHQRHWISIYSNLIIRLPEKDEQLKIEKVLSAADQEVAYFKKKIECLVREKKALMQQLLTGKKRVKLTKEAV